MDSFLLSPGSLVLRGDQVPCPEATPAALWRCPRVENPSLPADSHLGTEVPQQQAPQGAVLDADPPALAEPSDDSLTATS